MCENGGLCLTYFLATSLTTLGLVLGRFFSEVPRAGAGTFLPRSVCRMPDPTRCITLGRLSGEGARGAPPAWPGPWACEVPSPEDDCDTAPCVGVEFVSRSGWGTGAKGAPGAPPPGACAPGPTGEGPDAILAADSGSGPRQGRSSAPSHWPADP